MRPRTVSRVTSMMLGLPLALALAACGGRPGTPEELYERVAQLNAAGESGKIWDLLTDDARAQFIKNIEDFRVTLPRNPGTEGLVKQFNCTKDEFMVLSYVELYRRENLGRERVLLDAKITDKHSDPRTPGDQILTVVNPFKTTFYVRTRPVDGGWGLVSIISKVN